MLSPRRINVTRLAWVHYQHPDLDNAVEFLNHFGMTEAGRHGNAVYLRGFGIDPFLYIAEKANGPKKQFMGATFAVASKDDFDAAVAHPQALEVSDVLGPGGGKVVTLIDPNGNRVSFVYGQQLREKSDAGESRLASDHVATPNEAIDKYRKGRFVRMDEGPSPIHKLGHYGYGVPMSRFKVSLDWYLSLMNLKPTDIVFDPETGEDKMCFMHIDLGKTFTDHHCFFIAARDGDVPAHVHHSSFEVNDMDSQALGHNWLERKGYTNCWGLGRHVLGSQIFDYWFDTSSNIIEHYSDSDLVNEDTPTGREAESPHSLYIWGPNIPLGFVTGKIEDAAKQIPAPPEVAT